MFVLISVPIFSLFTPLPHDRTTETRNIKCENEVLNQEAAPAKWRWDPKIGIVTPRVRILGV